MNLPVFLGIFTLFHLLKSGENARILSVSFISSKSHKIVYEPLLYELGERGHDVTIYGPIASRASTKNVKNIQTYDPEELAKRVNLKSIFDVRESANRITEALNNPFIFFFPYINDACRTSYEHPLIQDLLKKIESGDPASKFDLVIFPPLWNDCIYGLIHKLNTTTIIISQLPILPWVSESVGSPSLPSVTPLPYYGFPGEMSFFQRMGNFLGQLYFMTSISLYYNPKVEALYREYVGADAPGVKEVQKNVSIVLSNSHISFNPPRPLLPDVIEVGGMHLRPAKPVEKSLEDFLSGNGEDGFILFSFGSYLQGSAMPEKYRQIFIRTFSRLKQRVLWKWETETMEGLPANVKLSKWIPQLDVLGHKNLRLFITHGGLGSTTEALYAGIPLVGIPMFADQASNMRQAVELGFGISLRYEHLTEEQLYDAIMKILQEPEKYTKKAKGLSAIFIDQINKPLDRAIYWVEYVLRHGGAPHLRSPARNLSFFQYYSLDVILALLTFGLVASLTSLLLLRAALRKIFGGGKKTVTSASKTKKKKQ